MVAGVAILAIMVVACFLLCYVEADGGFVKFEYTKNGTSNWGNLSPDYKTCSVGTRQSPINIMKHDATIIPKHNLYWNYTNANATLINHGYSVMLKFDQGVGFISQEGKKYTLNQLHWHTPSEHTIDNQQYPLELHIVHKADDGDTAVVSILYDLGKNDPLINQLKDEVAELAKKHSLDQEEAQVQVGMVRTKSLNRCTRKFFKYVGSLTTPPCTENVTWYILGKVRKVSKEQIAIIRSPLALEFHNNARPTQPLNGRVVELYHYSKTNLYSH